MEQAMSVKLKHIRKAVFSLSPLTIFLCLLPAVAFPAETDTVPEKYSGPRPVGAVNSSNGGVYEKGQYGIILKYITYEQDELYSGSDSVTYTRPVKGQKPGKTIKEKSFDQFQATLRAGITDTIDARIIIPYLAKELNRQSFNADFSDDASGIGDIKFLARYRFLSQKQKDPFNLALGVGIKAPTGDTDTTDSTGATPGYLQTGSGSWDPIIELGAHKVIRSHWLSTYFMYQMSTEGELGDLDYEKPDLFKYNLAYAYAVWDFFDLQMELNGEVKSKAEKAGVKQEDSGGHVVYLTPGVHFKFNNNLIHFDIGVAIPVYRDLNGTQVSEDYRVVSKLAFKF